jgi:hypothetical protein
MKVFLFKDKKEGVFTWEENIEEAFKTIKDKCNKHGLYEPILENIKMCKRS